MSKQTIALVGGTGNLGALIGNAVLDKPDVQLLVVADLRKITQKFGPVDS